MSRRMMGRQRRKSSGGHEKGLIDSDGPWDGSYGELVVTLVVG